jgi:hypothetical protein
MAADGSAASTLSDAATSIKIGQRVWKIGDPIYSIGESAVKKSKMVESFGAEYASSRAEGVIVGRGTNKKVRVRWTNLKDPEEIEYGFNHTIFKDPSDERREKAPKTTTTHYSQSAPLLS